MSTAAQATRPNTIMKALVINLDAATERWAFQVRQLSHLGIPHERLPAFGKDAEETADLPYWDTWERPLRRAERACLLSHQSAWQKVVDLETPLLIMEDDAILSDRVPDFLRCVDRNWDVDFVTLETRGRKKLISRDNARELPLVRLLQDRSGAAAYILWPTGARKLLAATETSCGLADAVICSCYDLRAFQAMPPLAFQSDQAEALQISIPLQTTSSISTASVARSRGNRHQRLRRISAQIRMGLRRLQFLGRAKRTLLAVRPQDFDYLKHLPPVTATTSPSYPGDERP